MADEVLHVDEKIGEEAGAEKEKRKSIKKASGWNTFYQAVAVGICYNCLLWIKHKLRFVACIICWHWLHVDVEKENNQICKKKKQSQQCHLRKLTLIFPLYEQMQLLHTNAVKRIHPCLGSDHWYF